MLTFELVGFKTIWESWKRILFIGIPTAASRMIIPISTGVITGTGFTVTATLIQDTIVGS